MSSSSPITAAGPGGATSSGERATGLATVLLALLLLAAVSGLLLLFLLPAGGESPSIQRIDLRATSPWGALPALHAWTAWALLPLTALYVLRRLGEDRARRRAGWAAVILLLLVAAASLGARWVAAVRMGDAASVAAHPLHVLVLPVLILAVVLREARSELWPVRRRHLVASGTAIGGVTALAVVLGIPPGLPWVAPWAALVPSLPDWLGRWAIPTLAAAILLVIPQLHTMGRVSRARLAGTALLLLWLLPLAAWVLLGERKIAAPGLGEWLWEGILRRPAPEAPLIRESPGIALLAVALLVLARLVARRRPSAALLLLVVLIAARSLLTAMGWVGDLIHLPSLGIRL